MKLMRERSFDNILLSSPVCRLISSSLRKKPLFQMHLFTLFMSSSLRFLFFCHCRCCEEKRMGYCRLTWCHTLWRTKATARKWDDLGHCCGEQQRFWFIFICCIHFSISLGFSCPLFWKEKHKSCISQSITTSFDLVMLNCRGMMTHSSP